MSCVKHRLALPPLRLRACVRARSYLESTSLLALRSLLPNAWFSYLVFLLSLLYYLQYLPVGTDAQN
ncbi:hypothetical protein LY76DRAFT_587790 [Colletotrichum caudatum]|nr:hypothetical protein LY76DRAFT_587790 [Colletotrichum caudatum]